MQLDNITCSIRIIKCLIVSSIEFKDEVKKIKNTGTSQLHNYTTLIQKKIQWDLPCNTQNTNTDTDKSVE